MRLTDVADMEGMLRIIRQCLHLRLNLLNNGVLSAIADHSDTHDFAENKKAAIDGGFIGSQVSIWMEKVLDVSIVSPKNMLKGK